MALGLVVFLWVMEEWVGSMEMRIGQWRLPENLGGEDHEFSERVGLCEGSSFMSEVRMKGSSNGVEFWGLMLSVQLDEDV
ncbi:hypothetical protein V6N13_000532 [Hibiscus sabdariffa]